MTIIAGFKCRDGVVIGGDTQETVSGLSKRNVTKIKV
jgi:20S proteasome alpha/beta subunit